MNRFVEHINKDYESIRDYEQIHTMLHFANQVHTHYTFLKSYFDIS